MKARPNDPCPCGSGLKFKKCHGRAPTVTSVSPVDGFLAQAARLVDQGALEAAETAIQRALQGDPRNLKAWRMLGDLAALANDVETAHHCYAHLVALDPGDAQAHYLLGNCLVQLFEFTRAREAYQRALVISPRLADAWGNLGNVLKYLGNHRDANACLLRNIELEANAMLRMRKHSNLLISLHFEDSLSHEALFQAHVDWAERYARRWYPVRPPLARARAAGEPLRLGYVSGSLNGQIVGHFLQNLLAHHDHARFHVTLFSTTRSIDAVTDRLRSLADAWVEIAGLDDAAGAARIQASDIDILVDLDGHSPTGRPLLFARKPAPVQVEWLDYFDTSGLATMDYFLTDPYSTPPDSPQRYVETPYRLPHTRFCYTPPAYAPSPAPSPALGGRPFTYGSFNRQDKLSPALIDTWAAILRHAPGTRLLLKNRGLQVEGARSFLLEQFAAAGVGPERLILRGPSPHATMLAEYAEIDVALDPFPYNGGLTSCECLWMGVPIVALEAERLIGRQTAAMLRLLGLDDWVAASRDDYIALAVAKHRDAEALAPVRAGLRARMAASPLCNGALFARDIEAAYLDIWQRACHPPS